MNSIVSVGRSELGIPGPVFGTMDWSLPVIVIVVAVG